MHIITELPQPIREIENTWVPLPDGTRLAARMWLPLDAEQHPVPAILEYLPYRKRDGTVERDQLTHPYFAGHGYASVRVDLRGTGDSEGVCLGEYLKQEQDDALAVIDWLSSQPWCSGKVGIIGISWGGFNGLQIAARQPPALAAVISLCSTDDRYADDIHFMGGCLLTDKLAWGTIACSITHTPPDPLIVGERWREQWQQRLDNNGLWMLDWFRHQRRDAFYQHGSICEDYSAVTIPVYAVGGWADGYTNAVFRMVEHLPGPCKGLIGPWAHKYPHFATPGPRIGFLQECLRWWDQHLKGIDTGIMQEPKLRAWIQDPVPPASDYEQREGHWIAEADWQGKAREMWTLCLNNPRLSEPRLDETQRNEPQLDHSHLSAQPADTTATIASPQNAGWTAASWCGFGHGDSALDQRGECGLMTQFDSDTLQHDIDLFGFPMLVATVRSDVPQANLVAVLSAINADGSTTLLSYGALNLTHRQSHAAPEALPLNEPVEVSLQLNALGQRIRAGQRLRLALSSAYWPVLWPAQQNATLQVSDGRLELPIRKPDARDHHLSGFPPAEAATPLVMDTLSDASYQRDRQIDYLTGFETYRRSSDTGAQRHQHSGMTVQYISEETFTIDPTDANSASGTCRWTKRYARDDWHASVHTEVSVAALRQVWRINATLRAEDNEGIVAEKQWCEDIPRDLV